MKKEKVFEVEKMESCIEIDNLLDNLSDHPSSDENKIIQDGYRRFLVNGSHIVKVNSEELSDLMIDETKKEIYKIINMKKMSFNNFNDSGLLYIINKEIMSQMNLKLVCIEEDNNVFKCMILDYEQEFIKFSDEEIKEGEEKYDAFTDGSDKYLTDKYE